MIITKMTRYGTRAVFDIAYYSSGMPVHVKDIAKRQEVPLKFLEQIFHKLKKAAFIKSVRGPHGGYVLTKDPSEITVGDIMKAVDEPFDLVCCVSDTQACQKTKQCVTRPIWKETSKRIEDYLSSVTIADLCGDAGEKGLKTNITNSFDYNI